MYYYHQKTDTKGLTYSCDMVRVKFDMREDQVTRYNEWVNHPYRTDIKTYPLDLRPYKYRLLSVIDYGTGKLTLGLSFNDTGRKLESFLEFNPNKCFQNPQCQKDIDWILLNASVSEVVRCDIAIDIPYPRDKVHMVKDQRKYGSDGSTAYLGRRNEVGRVKLYDKRVESDLEQDLTRVELTTTLDFAETIRLLPRVWLEQYQMELELHDSDELSQNERVFAMAIRDSSDPEYYLKQLTYRMRKKVEPFILGTELELDFDKIIIKDILTEQQRYCK